MINDLWEAYATVKLMHYTKTQVWTKLYHRFFCFTIALQKERMRFKKHSITNLKKFRAKKEKYLIY